MSLDHALDYAKCGIRVLPIKPGTKRPPMNEWVQAATTDPAIITSWFTGMYADHGVGLAMGRQPDGRFIFALDVDEHDAAHSGGETLADLQARHGKLPDTVRLLTGSGGLHLLFTAPPGVEVRNGSAGDGVDVRGEGGQIVVAPSIHPGTGRRYECESGFAPWEHNIAEATGWLLDIVKVAPAPPQPQARPQLGTMYDFQSPDSPAEWLRSWWRWPGELRKAGWTEHHVDHNGDEYWTRPGKPTRDGESAVLHPDGRFVVFSTDASLFTLLSTARHINVDGGRTVSPFEFYAAYEHGGDMSAAARFLITKMPEADSRLPPPQGDGDVPCKVTFRTADQFDTKPARQLIRGWFPRGELCIVAGKPGVGKGIVITDICARGSRGVDLPNGDRPLGPFVSGVICLPGEDSADEWARRLTVADAQLDRVMLAETIPDSAGVEHPISASTIAAAVEGMARQGAGLVVVDSFAGLANSAGKDTNKGEVRAVLDDLSEVARRFDLTIVIIHHVRKAQGDPLDILQGNTQIGAAVRSVLVAVEERVADGAEPDVILFGVAKLNGSKRSKPVGFRTVGRELFHQDGQPMRDDRGDVVYVARVQWIKDRTFTQGEFIAACNGSVLRSSDRDDAATDILANGPMASTEYMKEMDDAGFSADQAKRARDRVGETKRHGGKWWSYPKSMDSAAAAQAIEILASGEGDG